MLLLSSVLFGTRCAHPGIRCLQRLDLGLDLPLERAPPLGKLGLAKDFQPALSVTLELSPLDTGLQPGYTGCVWT